MMTRIVTEGAHDELFLRRLLSSRLPGTLFRVIAAGGTSSAVSLARSYLATQSDRLILVADADTTDPASVELRRERIYDALSDVAASDRYCVVIAVPEIEEWFFPSAAAATRLLKRQISETELADIRRHPKEELGRIFSPDGSRRFRLEDYEKIMHLLDFDAISETSEIKSMLEFVQAPHSALQS